MSIIIVCTTAVQYTVWCVAVECVYCHSLCPPGSDPIRSQNVRRAITWKLRTCRPMFVWIYIIVWTYNSLLKCICLISNHSVYHLAKLFTCGWLHIGYSSFMYICVVSSLELMEAVCENPVFVLTFISIASLLTHDPDRHFWPCISSTLLNC
jgi:hypothetical protein